MTLVLVVQSRLFVFPQKALPGTADRNDRRAQLPADARVCVGNGLLRFGRVLWGPRQIEDRLRAGGLDRRIKESNALVHSLGVLDRQRALLLKHDGVVLTILDRLPRFAGVPVMTKRRPAGADKPVLKALGPRGRQLRDQAGQIVAG